MKKVFIACLLFLPYCLLAQYPGGVNTNLKLWLKANSGISLNPTNTVSQWNELSGAGVTGNFATQGSNIGMAATQNPPMYVAAGINFNPHVSFSQNVVNSISSNNAFIGTQLLDPYNNSVLQVINLHTLNNTGVWFKWQYSNTNVNRLGNEVNNGGTNAGKIRFDFRGTNNFSNTIVNDQYYLAGYNTTQATSIIRLNGNNDAVLNYTGQAAFAPATNSPARITIGNEEYGDAYPTTIDVAEVILFNKALSAAERNKVESYLAVKYGFTLDQSAANANDYTSSNGTIIWNRSNNLPFVNNITGIGRDDGDSLIQRQSRSINTAGLVTIYNGVYNGSTFPTLNTSNVNNFQADNTYLLFGDNAGTTTLNRCFSGNPSFLRMNRTWKVQMTGSLGTVTLGVKASDMPANTMHLLVSTDSAFTPANTIAYRLDTNNSILSRSLMLQSGTYFTFASDSLLIKASSNSPLCVGATLQLNAVTAGSATFLWVGPNGFTSGIRNPSIPGAGSINSGTYMVTATVNGCTFKPASVVVAVSPIPAPPKVVTPVLYCQNDSAVALTAVGQELTWYRTPASGLGTTIPPIPSTVYVDTIVYWVTQGNNGCESVRTKLEVHVTSRPYGIIVGNQATICQGDVDTFFYFGNGTPDMEYNWKAPIGRTLVLGGSGQGPLAIRFDSAGVTSVRLQLNNDGCVGNEMLFPVTVNPRPFAHPVIQSDACVNDIVNIALNHTSSAITGFNWDFDNGYLQYGGSPGGPFGIIWNTAGTKLVTMITSSAGCKSLKRVDTVMVHALPVAGINNIAPNDICMGDSVFAQAIDTNPADTFLWSPVRYFKDSSGSSAWGVVDRSGYVSLKVTSPWGCTSTDSALVTAHPCCQVSFPTAFTPNNDGKNDRFRIITNGHHVLNSFRVLNRWGQVIFETRDETKGWDGTFNGVLQDVGTYYYYVRFRCKEGNGHDIEQKGEVILVR